MAKPELIARAEKEGVPPSIIRDYRRGVLSDYGFELSIAAHVKYRKSTAAKKDEKAALSDEGGKPLKTSKPNAYGNNARLHLVSDDERLREARRVGVDPTPFLEGRMPRVILDDKIERNSKLLDTGFVPPNLHTHDPIKDARTELM